MLVDRCRKCLVSHWRCLSLLPFISSSPFSPHYRIPHQREWWDSDLLCNCLWPSGVWKIWYRMRTTDSLSRVPYASVNSFSGQNNKTMGVKAIRTYLFLIDQSILFFHVDYLVDIIPKQKSVPRMRKAPKKKKVLDYGDWDRSLNILQTQAELNSPQLPSNRTEPTNLMEESAPSKTKEDTIDDEKKLWVD